jgi:hypothetical protein
MDAEIKKTYNLVFDDDDMEGLWRVCDYAKDKIITLPDGIDLSAIMLINAIEEETKRHKKVGNEL